MLKANYQEAKAKNGSRFNKWRLFVSALDYVRQQLLPETILSTLS